MATSGSSRRGRALAGRGLWVGLAFLALAPVVLLSLRGAQVAADAVRAHAEDEVEASAIANASAMEEGLWHMIGVPRAYSGDPALQEVVAAGDVAGTRARLEVLVQNTPYVSVAFVTDPAGIAIDVQPATPGIVGADLGSEGWYRGAVESGEPYLMGAHEPVASGMPPVVVAAAPIRSAAGDTIGVVAAGMSLDTLQGLVDRFSDSQLVTITITDQAGIVVASSAGAPTTLVSLASDPGVAEALDGRRSVQEVDRDGDSYISASAPVEGFGWTVTAEVPSAQALAEVNRLHTYNVMASVTVALFILVSFGALVRILRRQSRTAKALERSEAFLESVVDNIPCTVFVKRADTLEFERVNTAGESLFGRDRSDIVGRTNADLFPPDQAEAYSAADRLAISTGELTAIPVEAIESDRGTRLVHTRRVPIAATDGTPGYLLGISEDITEAVTTSEQLTEAKNEAERANRAKSEFLSRMSHELRTPLNAILGFGQLLELDDLSDQQQEGVDQILRGGRHLLELINEILDLARIETGRLALSLEAIHVDTVATEALDLMRPAAAQAGVELTAAIDDPSLYVHADQQRLKQALLNLLANAIKYGGERGHVSLDCSINGDDLVRISITDTGPGVTADDIGRMFRPFERLDADSSAIEGSGLGLALTKQLVEAMGGEVGVESELGVGSTFRIDLPIAPSPVADDDPSFPVAEPTLDAAAHHSRILYIEDDQSIAQLAQRLLDGRPDITVITAATGDEGIAMAAQHQPDLVLLDLDLPGTSGDDVLRRLRSQPRTTDTPIVIVSADDDRSQIARSRADGATDYVTKPIDIDRLNSIVEEHLGASGVRRTPVASSTETG